MNDNLNEKSIQNALGFPVKPTIWFSLKRQELNIKGKFLLFPIKFEHCSQHDQKKLLYKTLYIVDVARVSQLMARRMYGIGSRTTENSGPIKLSRQCAMALCRALLTWLFGKSMISKTESKHCSQPCFHKDFTRTKFGLYLQDRS